MKIVIFGLTISSSWGNGHATLWRGLCRALAERGHEVQFFERDVSYYAQHRDYTQIPGGRLWLYGAWEEVKNSARELVGAADLAMVTSYCVDATPATELVLESNAGCRCFYDLDTGVTLSNLRAGRPVDYIGPEGLRDFDLVLTYVGGKAEEELRSRLGARRVAALYGSVDPQSHYPTSSAERFLADLSYLGTYDQDRQGALQELFIEPARRLPERRFMLGGALYPQSFPWTSNIYFMRHVSPAEHAAFYCSSKLTLNITRPAMADFGYCPSGRLFEAAACGVPIVSDWFDGLDSFLNPASEILVCSSAEDVIAAIEKSNEELSTIARLARERVLRYHTAEARVRELENLLTGAASTASLSFESTGV